MSTRTASRSLAFVVALVALAAFLAPAPAEAATFTYPSAGCPASATGLNACIGASADGDHINVKPGFYNERATVNHAVTVAGPCKGKPAIIDGNGLAGNIFDIQHSDVTISCLTIQNNGGNGIDNSTPFDGLHVAKVKVSHVDDGIFTNGGAGLIVKRSTFSGMGDSGIYVDGTSTSATITGNTLSATSAFCIYFNDTSTTDVSKNAIDRCGNDGVFIQAGATNTVTKNSVRTVNNNGLAVWSTATKILNNSVNGSKNSAVSSTGSSNTIQGNKALGASDNEAFELSGTSLIVKNNVVSKGAKFSGILCDPCDGATITGNSVLARVGAFGINVVGDVATISGNKVTGGGHNNGIAVSGKTPVVTNNLVSGGFRQSGFVFDCTGTCDLATLSGNTESGSTEGGGFDVTTNGCSLFPCTEIVHNKASDNRTDAFFLSVAFADVKNNAAAGSGWGGCQSGFDIIGPSNHLTSNVATGSSCDGFRINDANNVLSKNTASKNGQMGFHNHDTSTSFDKNVAKKNIGDGFNNDGTLAKFTNNVASGNRQDCTNDVTLESASIVGLVTSNSCADGFVFTQDSTLNDFD